MGDLIKKLVVVAILVGLGYGGFMYYKSHKKQIDASVEKHVENPINATGTGVGVGAQHKKDLEDAQ